MDEKTRKILSIIAIITGTIGFVFMVNIFGR